MVDLILHFEVEHWKAKTYSDKFVSSFGDTMQ